MNPLQPSLDRASLTLYSSVCLSVINTVSPSLPRFRVLNSQAVSLIDIASMFTHSSQVFIPNPITYCAMEDSLVGGTGGRYVSLTLSFLGNSIVFFLIVGHRKILLYAYIQ